MIADEYQARIHADKKRRRHGHIGWLLAGIMAIALGSFVYQNRQLERVLLQKKPPDNPRNNAHAKGSDRSLGEQKDAAVGPYMEIASRLPVSRPVRLQFVDAVPTHAPRQ